MKRTFYTILITALMIGQIHAQLFIDNSISPEQMVMDFFDNSCVTPSNVTFNGAPMSVAYFEAANTDLGINAGIVISTGDVNQLVQTAAEFAATSNGTSGDSDLEALIGSMMPSFDAAVLEFDISVEDGGDLDFEYVFGSEEYPEFVGASFNDVFGFLISGPGTPAPFNIANIPGTMTPTTINNVNANMNSQYYIPYAQNNGQHVVFDGLTTNLPAVFASQAAETYHVKIGVTDIGDAIFDSGVFIGIESLCGDSLLTPPADAAASVDDQTVTFTNLSRYATSWHWDFGDNTTSTERFPEPHTYAQSGTYTVTLTTQNWCCTDTYEFTVQVGSTNTNEAFQKPFSIYPNPATDAILFQSDSEKTFEYELSDFTGKVLTYGKIRGGERLDLTQFLEGIYLLNVKNEYGNFVERVVIR